MPSAGMPKMVVTGGLGFSGPHLVDALLAAGREVRIIGSLVAAVSPNGVHRHLDSALGAELPVVNLGNHADATIVWGLAERVVERLAVSSPIEHTDARLIHGPLYEEPTWFESSRCSRPRRPWAGCRASASTN